MQQEIHKSKIHKNYQNIKEKRGRYTRPQIQGDIIVTIASLLLNCCETERKLVEGYELLSLA